MMKRVDVAVYETIRDLVGGKSKAGVRAFGLKEGGVGYAVNQHNRELMKSISPRLEALKRDIIAGKIKVPSDRKQLDAFVKTLK
jgi:basic membrane protein A